MSLINKLFRKDKPAAGKIVKSVKEKKSEIKKEAAVSKKEEESEKKKVEFKPDGVLISPLATEKAVSGQSLNKYIFKVAPRANKIDIIRAVSKIYKVKAVSANIINVPRKSRQVGKTRGFKSGYKKAIVTLAKGQNIEVK